ncbi:MAG: sigma-70 family RNA polymerase sigma factor [Lachnospiraceae bacterium]|nr:sigma-70 family RNA polymerase sigma factor [Lachnospiraceae bacterium]
MDNGASSYRRFLEGDESAFDDIIREYRNSLTFFINRYVHDIDAAEDIAIDVFMELIVYRNRYNFKTSLKTYLFMVGRSRAIDYIRRHNKFRLVEYDEVADELTDDYEVEDTLLQDERKRVINNALSELPKDMRVAIHLVYFEELSYKEVAEIMRKTTKQIDNLLYRSKDRLRTILGKEGELLI